MTAIMAAKWVADALNKVNMLYLFLIFNNILLLYTSFEQIIFDGSRREIWQTLAPFTSRERTIRLTGRYSVQSSELCRPCES